MWMTRTKAAEKWGRMRRKEGPTQWYKGLKIQHEVWKRRKERDLYCHCMDGAKGHSSSGGGGGEEEGGRGASQP